MESMQEVTGPLPSQNDKVKSKSSISLNSISKHKPKMPGWLALLIFLPSLAVMKLICSYEYVGREFSPSYEGFRIKEQRIIDFKSALTEHLENQRMQQEELGGLFDTLKTLDLNSMMKTMDTGITTLESCHTCSELYKAGKICLRSFTKKEMLKMAKIACATVLTDMVEPVVCRGLISQYLDTIYYIGSNILSEEINATDICALMLGPTCGNITSQYHTWSVNLPPFPTKEHYVSKRNLPEQVDILHLSDFHFDPEYEEGTVAECLLPLCCRRSSMFDLEVNATNVAGRFGDTRKCDLPLVTIEALVDDAASQAKKLSHIYLTGDIPPHDVWASSPEEYFNITTTVYGMLRNKFGSAPLLPCIGNHEAVPPNLFSETTAPRNNRVLENTPRLYKQLADIWSPWLSKSELKTVQLGGFYAKTISKDLKVISLNTNFCYYLNFWLLLDSRDPGNQLKWMIRELAKSEKRNQKVHIIAHIPPGYFDCTYAWSYQYRRIIDRFNATITGQFYGHTHFDEFKVFFSESEPRKAISAAFIAPSATPYSGVNPAYKIFKADQRGNLYDFVTRSVDIHEANKIGKLEFQTEYTAKEAYDVESLSPSNMDNISTMIAIDQRWFDKYFNFFHRHSNSSRWQQCDENCKQRMSCSLRTGVHHDTSACL